MENTATHDWNTANDPYCSVVIMRVRIGVANKASPLFTTLQTVNQNDALAGFGIFLYDAVIFIESGVQRLHLTPTPRVL